jgi:hypothetical protein
MTEGEALREAADRLREVRTELGWTRRWWRRRSQQAGVDVTIAYLEALASDAGGCHCTELCSMGPTCPGGMKAGLPGSGCWRTQQPHDEHDWHHPYPGSNLQCRRCHLWHGAWSGDPCPQPLTQFVPFNG